MAQIRKITPQPVLSNLRQAAPSVGIGFRVLAGAMETAYQSLEPAAILEQQQKGAASGHSTSGGPMPQPGSPASNLNISSSLAATESGGNYSIVNSEGYTGKYQWGQGRLDDFNRANGTSYTLDQFRNSPAVQEQAQSWHESDILSNTSDLIGRTVNGIEMTPAALIAVAHLGGTGGARRFVETNGAYDPADSNGTHLSDYARTHAGATVSTQSAPLTAIKTADGTVEQRLYSPASGPILQAYNAAAQVAYQSDMIVKGTADLMAISSQFPLDPEGFAQAAQGYVSQAVSGAPAMFREDLQSEMQGEVTRRYLGLMDARQSDIRQRADSSSQALLEIWGGNLTDAIAGGNPDEIAAAQEKLDGLLAARENLPGVGWTPAQSELVRQRATAGGQAEIDRRRTEADKVAKAAATEAQRRTDASAQALTEMWGDRVTTAMASGDIAAAMKAQAELDKVLAAREASQGAIWTPEQSANERAKYIAAGSAKAAAATAAATAQTTLALDRALDLAKSGGMDPQESRLLSDPTVAAKFPEKAATLAALADLRTTLPTFTAAPKAEREAQIAAIGVPDSPGEVAKLKALTDVNREINAAFQKDPIVAASTYLPVPPPPIPDAQTDPAQAVTMLQARREYADGLVAQGYAPKAAYLSATETELVGSLFSKEAPIEARLAAAEMVTEGFGPAAAQVFSTLKNADPTTRAAGMMSASTGSRDVAMEAMMGRAMLDAGQAKPSFKFASVRSVDPATSDALAGIPVPDGDVMALAAGIMAYQHPEGFDKKDAAAMQEAARDAVSRALGKTKLPTGEVVGGVQPVMGRQTLLPGDVSAEAVEAAIGYMPGSGGISGMLTQGFLDMAGVAAVDPAATFATAGLGASAGSVPMMGGIPLKPGDITSGELRFMSAGASGWGDGAYVMTYRNQPVRNATGSMFVFDMRALVGK